MTPVNKQTEQKDLSSSPNSGSTAPADGKNRQTSLANLPYGIEVNNIEPTNTPTSPSNKKKKKDKHPQDARIPFFITNLSSTSRVELPKDHTVAFITPEDLR